MKYLQRSAIHLNKRSWLYLGGGVSSPPLSEAKLYYNLPKKQGFLKLVKLAFQSSRKDVSDRDIIEDEVDIYEICIRNMVKAGGIYSCYSVCLYGSYELYQCCIQILFFAVLLLYRGNYDYCIRLGIYDWYCGGI